MYPTTQTGDLWPHGVLLESQILNGVKCCNAFLQGGFTNRDEIWHDGGGIRSQQVSSNFGEFWPTFSGSKNIRSQISRTLLVRLPQNSAWLWVWPMDISSWNLVNFDSGVRRCHVVTL